jgi:hypothetical protein
MFWIFDILATVLATFPKIGHFFSIFWSLCSSPSLTGIPLPKVTWWTGGALYDSSDEVTRNGVIVNRMVYKDLQRQDLGKKFLCQAANTNLTIPVSREVKITLNCKFNFCPPNQGSLFEGEGSVQLTSLY